MDKRNKDRALLRKDIAQPANRSSLFWWLLENHDWMLREAGGRRMLWGPLSGRFAELGLADMTGKPATPQGARLTWKRVRKERQRLDARRAAEEAAQAVRRAADPRKKMPSRILGPVGPALAEQQTELPAGAMLWNDFYYKDEEGRIQPVQKIPAYIGKAGAARIRQESNLSIGRPIDNGIEKLIGPRKEYGA